MLRHVRVPRPAVLVSDGGTEQSKPSLAAVRALAAGGYRPLVTVSGGLSLAAASRFCAGRVPVPSVHLSPDAFREAITKHLEHHDYVAVLPTGDRVIRELRLPSHELLDKGVLEERAPASGLRCPPSVRFASGEELIRAAGDLDYPVVVKAAALRATRRVTGPDDLRHWRGAPGPLLAQPFLTDPQHSVSGVIWDGRLVASMHQRYLRMWPPDPGGAAAAVVSTDPDIAVERRLLHLLREHEGPFQAQFRGEFLLDLNPRVSTSLPLAVASGVNLPAIYCDLRRGMDVPELRGRPGVFYRWLDGDVRSVMWAWRRGRMSARDALRALWPRPGTAHGPESLLDPGPTLARALAARHKLAGLLRRPSAP